MTKREMVEYINNAKQDKVIRRLMKYRKVKEVNESMSKVVITIAYKSVKQIKEELGIEVRKRLSEQDKKHIQKVQIMLYGKKEFDCDKYNHNHISKRKLVSQENAKRSLRKIIIKSCLTGKEYTFYNAKFMTNQGLFSYKKDGIRTMDLPYQDLKKGDKLYRTYIYRNNTYNYVYDLEYGLCSSNDRCFYEEQYEVVKVEDKQQNYSVYQITNDIDDIKYFGITNNYKRRYNSHFIQQKEDKMLYYHMKHLGKEHFKMELLYENIPTKRLAEKIETILILGNMGKISNEIISCCNWYDTHSQLNDFNTFPLFDKYLFDKEQYFLVRYNYYQEENNLSFIYHANYGNELECAIYYNLREIGLKKGITIDIENILSYDRNKVVLK